MENNNMKNIIVLKNLPSNLIEEAIMIVKSNKFAKKIEYIEKPETKNIEPKEQDKTYIIREAESIIYNYIKELEEKEKQNLVLHTLKKYKTLKIYSVIITVSFILLAVLL